MTSHWPKMGSNLTPVTTPLNST